VAGLPEVLRILPRELRADITCAAAAARGRDTDATAWPPPGSLRRLHGPESRSGAAWARKSEPLPWSGDGKTTAEVHDYHDELTGVLASSLAKRAPGYTSLGFPDPRKLAYTPSPCTAREAQSEKQPG
jgi:hypothetical protein